MLIFVSQFQKYNLKLQGTFYYKNYRKKFLSSLANPHPEQKFQTYDSLETFTIKLLTTVINTSRRFSLSVSVKCQLRVKSILVKYQFISLSKYLSKINTSRHSCLDILVKNQLLFLFNCHSSILANIHSHCTQCFYAECFNADCYHVDCLNADCNYAKCLHTKCRGPKY